MNKIVSVYMGGGIIVPAKIRTQAIECPECGVDVYIAKNMFGNDVLIEEKFDSGWTIHCLSCRDSGVEDFNNIVLMDEDDFDQYEKEEEIEIEVFI